MTKVFPISRFTVHGNSMIPVLRSGQDIVSFNWAYLGKKPKVGDIVVVDVNGREMVKRIHYLSDRLVYVLGDNSDESTDSRDFGEVSVDQIIGKVIFSSENHPERAEPFGSEPQGRRRVEGSNMIPCPQCGSEVIGIFGRKDAICSNCGFKLSCCK